MYRGRLRPKAYKKKLNTILTKKCIKSAPYFTPKSPKFNASNKYNGIQIKKLNEYVSEYKYLGVIK